MRIVAILTACAVLVSVAPTAAQEVTGTIRGTITDASGAVLPNAVLTVNGTTLIGGTATVHPNQDGTYRAWALPPGLYELAATHAGLQTVRRTRVIVEAGSAIVLDFVLRFAGQRDAVDVVAESPVIDANSTAIPVRVTQDLLFNLPLARNVAALINLAPGVSANYPQTMWSNSSVVHSFS